MENLLYLVALIFTLFGAVCVALVLIGLPGTWLMIAVAVVIELIDVLYLPEGSRQTFSWWVLVFVLMLAFIAELVEFGASAAGARYGGASKRGMIGSLIGAVAGGIVGTFAIPIPVVGSLLGAMLGAAIGAIAGELSAPGVRLRDAWRPASGAAIGRLAGSLGKVPFAVAVWLVLSVAAFWP